MKNWTKKFIFLGSLFSLFMSGCNINKQSLFLDNIKNATVVGKDTLMIKTLSLGETGDCTLIKFNNTEILIDAGGGSKSASIIKAALTESVTDKCLEYVLMTHSDYDHIVSFVSSVGEWANEGDNYISTLIDFDIYQEGKCLSKIGSEYVSLASQKTVISSAPTTLFSTLTYVEYAACRDSLIFQDKIKNYHVSTLCNFKHSNNRSKYYSLSNSNPNEALIKKALDAYGDYSAFEINSDVKLHILYNYFSDHVNSSQSKDINNISMCVMLDYHNKKFLFTGDLEEFDSAGSNNKYSRIYGETNLYLNNRSLLEGGVYFYKAAHHCSDTSNSKEFMDIIRPQYVAVNVVFEPNLQTIHKCSKYKEKNRINYGFPKQVALDNITQWTDYVYFSEK